MTRSLETCPDGVCAAASGSLEPRRSAPGFAAALVALADAGLDVLVDTIFTWQQRHADRLRLQGLDDRMLRDIGLSRADIEAEAAKPFWRP